MKNNQAIHKFSKLDQYHLHEFTDRAHLIVCMMEDHLSDHPLTEADEHIQSKLDEAISIISELYQYSGGLHFAMDEIEDLLKEFSNDYQFDKSNIDYLGFLNTCPKEEWSETQCMAWDTLIKNHSLFLIGMLKRYGLRVADGPSIHETIFYKLEDEE